MYKNQKGGVTAIGDPDEAFDIFFTPSDTSSISYLSKGIEGVTFICTNDNSQYYAFRPHLLTQKVTRVVVKLSLLHEPETARVNGVTKSISKHEFDDEIELQLEAIESTIGFFEPVSPTILYQSNNNITSLIDRLLTLHPTQYTIDILNSYKSSERWNTSIGVIVMECSSGVESFSRLGELLSQDTMRNQQNYAVAIFELFRLALCGINQGDYHLQNILFSTSYPDYFISDTDEYQWYLGKRALIIDFGRGNVFTSEKKEEFARNYEKISIDDETTLEDRFKSYQMCIKIIYENGQYASKTKFNNPSFRWFLDESYRSEVIMRYVIELVYARGRAIHQTIEQTSKYVTDSIGEAGTELSGDAEIQYEEYKWVNPNLMKFVIQHLQKVNGSSDNDVPLVPQGSSGKLYDVPQVPPRFSEKVKEKQKELLPKIEERYGDWGSDGYGEWSSDDKTSDNPFVFESDKEPDLNPSEIKRKEEQILLHQKPMVYDPYAALFDPRVAYKSSSESSSNSSTFDPYAPIFDPNADLNKSGSKGGKRNKFKGGLNETKKDIDYFITLVSLIKSIGIQALIQESCFTSVFILYSHGKSGELSKAYDSLSDGLQRVVYEKQTINHSLKAPPKDMMVSTQREISVFGGNKKKRNKTKKNRNKMYKRTITKRKINNKTKKIKITKKHN